MIIIIIIQSSITPSAPILYSTYPPIRVSALLEKWTIIGAYIDFVIKYTTQQTTPITN